jgi:hypothetical protein
LASPSQFRAKPPPSLKSAEWARDYNEIKDLGAKNRQDGLDEAVLFGAAGIVAVDALGKRSFWVWTKPGCARNRAAGMAPKVEFARDSALERNGFELPVPREIGSGFEASAELGPIDRRRGSIIRAVFGLGKPTERCCGPLEEASVSAE